MYADAVDGANSHFGKFDDIEFEEAEEERTTMRKHSPFMSRCWACFKQERHKHSSALTFVDNTIMGVTTSLYFGVIGFAGMSPSHVVRTFPGRLIVVGFVLFAVVVLTNYTASSAAGFVFLEGKSSTMLNDWKEVVATKRPICVREALLLNVQERYPGIPPSRFLGVNAPSAHMEVDMMLQSMDAGECVAAIIAEDMWSNVQRRSDQCNKTDVTTLFSEANAMVRQHAVFCMFCAVFSMPSVTQNSDLGAARQRGVY